MLTIRYLKRILSASPPEQKNLKPPILIPPPHPPSPLPHEIHYSDAIMAQWRLK